MADKKVVWLMIVIGVLLLIASIALAKVISVNVEKLNKISGRKVVTLPSSEQATISLYINPPSGARRGG